MGSQLNTPTEHRNKCLDGTEVHGKGGDGGVSYTRSADVHMRDVLSACQIASDFTSGYKTFATATAGDIK